MTRNETRGSIPVNEQQAAIVDSVLAHQATIASAGAGSGKTHTMIATVMHLLEHNRPGSPTPSKSSVDQLAVVTFTTAAAEQLRRKVEMAIDARVMGAEATYWLDQRERLSAAFIGTIHSYSHRLLKGFGYAGGVPRTSAMARSSALLREAIADEYEALFDGDPDLQALLHADVPEHQLLRRTEGMLDHLSRVGLTPHAVLDATRNLEGDGYEVRVALATLIDRADRRYRTVKMERGAVDVDDLLLKLRDALREPQAAHRAAGRYPLLFIDEFQDTDRVQVDIIRSLLPGLRRLLVVGDIKQSIYGFRAADAQLLPSLAAELGTQVLPLNVSRRPTAELLNDQNDLFSSIGARYPVLADPLDSFEGTPASPSTLPSIIHDPATKDDAPGAIARWITALIGMPVLGGHGERGAEQADIVLLCRTNRHVDDLTTRVSAALRPPLKVRQASGLSFFEQPEVVATYRVLQVLLT